MNYILNSLEEIQKVYTPSIEELQESFLPCLPEFKLSKKAILESMRFRNKLSDSKGNEGLSSELSVEAILTGIKYNLISKSNVIHNFDYDSLLRNIDLEIFKTELNKLLLNQENSFVKEIEDTLENSNSDLKFNRYFKNKIENLIESENYLKSLISNQNDFIQLIINGYIESYSKTYNQLKKEYLDLLPQYFELKKTDILDDSIEINQKKINDNDLLQKYIDDYGIFSLYSLEPILEDQIVTITFDNPIYDKELDCTYTIDEVKLILSQYNFQDEKDRNYDENDYRHYANEFSEDMKTWKLQKLNYEDFITYENDFKDIVKQKLIDIEKEILKLIPEFISKNIDKIENIKYLINYTMIKKWNKDNLNLLNRFHNNEFVIVSYKSIRKIPLITDVMNIVYDRKEDFVKKIKNDFSFYYVEEYHETEFSRSLKKLDLGLNKESQTEKKDNYFKIGLLIAKDELRLCENYKPNEDSFVYLKKGYKSANSVAKEISKETRIKETTVRPIISATLTNSIIDSNNRNIFHIGKLDKIEKIHNYCISNGITISKYFMEKYNKLKQNI